MPLTGSDTSTVILSEAKDLLPIIFVACGRRPFAALRVVVGVAQGAQGARGGGGMCWGRRKSASISGCLIRCYESVKVSARKFSSACQLRRSALSL